MRSCFRALGMMILLSASSALQAQVAGSSSQQSGQSSGLTQIQQKIIEGVMAAWEADAKNLQSLFVVFRIEEKGDPFSPNKILASHGEAKVLKLPSGQFGLNLEVFNLAQNGQVDRSSIKEKYVYSGSLLYTFDFSNKIITSRKINNQQMVPADGPFAFLFGMKAADARKRFAMTIVQDDPATLWVRIQPLTAQDQQYFTIVQIGIAKATGPNAPKDFPGRIMWKEPGGKELDWKFQSVVRNNPAQITEADFSIENEKRLGWQVREAPPLGATAPPPSPGLPTSGNGPPRK
ncbi:MAG TPA: hypothetical protein PLN21_12260 [Gemmatales bacterium]|nr:hypothetical protein [Gemmatales bacterium]